MWTPERSEAVAPRSVSNALWRGLIGRCPNCGKGPIFRAYLKVNDRCPACGEELMHHRADDAPPYVTILIVGHIVVGLLLEFDLARLGMPVWLQLLFWCALVVVLSMVFLPRIKGALVAYQWALRMHGFETAASAPPATAGSAPVTPALTASGGDGVAGELR